MTITTTLNRIRAHGPCSNGWEKLLKGLGKIEADDEPLPYSKIVEINGLDDALWCCRAEPEQSKTWRLFAVWCARQVQHLMTDERSVHAINVAERHANGLATDDELDAAYAAARDARDASDAAARAASYATSDAAWAAWIAARAAWNAARDAARDAQKSKFLEMVG
jgi:hypothetical protein